MTGPAQTEERLSEVRFLTVAEVASLMRVSKMTVYRLVHGGDLTAVPAVLEHDEVGRAGRPFVPGARARGARVSARGFLADRLRTDGPVLART